MVPINIDRNVSIRDYDKVPADKLLVTSVFRTIQGEGPYAGEPALFIRLAGCNLGAKLDCAWCDTRFAIDEGHQLSLEQLRDEILEQRERLDAPIRLVVFTGGEPLLQKDKVFALERMVNTGDPRPRSIPFQFETNGLLMDADDHDAARIPRVCYVVSPKIPHKRTTYPSLNPLWVGYAPELEVYLKFVVSADPASPYHRLPSDISRAVARRVLVYVSGMTVYRRPLRTGEVANLWDDTLIDREATARNYAHAAATVLSQPGLTLSYQTHLLGAIE
jgi:7-carboxy-7-deazaguanine synthase